MHVTDIGRFGYSKVRAAPTDADVVHELEHSPQAVGAARRLARQLLDRWKVADVDTVLLVVSELVTNALEHALPPVILSVRRDSVARQVWVQVTDGGAAPRGGAWAASCADEEHGRGLDIVAALTTDHGEYTLANGAATRWARFSAA
ncbi:ATP-binding protein [Streptomyces sp. NPDC051001]|uniref:ATP-binding protein n=1 Tax=Streptomyces sp. NPDC051001 TaxID=3155795 RepID=UPI00342408CA